MPQNLILSFIFHMSVIVIAVVSFPFIPKKPLDIPPLVSVELIQITDQTNIPFAPKAEQIIEKVKKEKEKPDAIPLLSYKHESIEDKFSKIQ